MASPSISARRVAARYLQRVSSRSLQRSLLLLQRDLPRALRQMESAAKTYERHHGTYKGKPATAARALQSFKSAAGVVPRMGAALMEIEAAVAEGADESLLAFYDEREAYALISMGREIESLGGIGSTPRSFPDRKLTSVTLRAYIQNWIQSPPQLEA